MSQRDTQQQGKPATQEDPEMNARLDTIIGDIRKGELRRRRKEESRFARAAESEGSDQSIGSKIFSMIGKGIIGLLSLPFKAAEFAARVGVGVLRKTVDKLAGTNWEEEAKQSKLNVLGLQEMGKENLEKYQQEIKDRQEEMSRLHLEQSRLEDDMRAKTMRSLETNDPQSAESKGVAVGGIPSITDNEAKNSDSPTTYVDSFEMKLLAEMSYEYHHTVDGRFQSIIESLKEDSLEALKSQDSLLLMRAVQKIVCASDPLLGGREGIRKELEGPNATIRIGANQVVAYSITEALVKKAAASGNPQQHMEAMIKSLEKSGSSANSPFFQFVLSEANRASNHRDIIYKELRDPANTGRKTDWAWLKKAHSEYHSRLKGFKNELEQNRAELQSRGLPSASNELEGGEHEQLPDEGVEGERISNREQKVITHEGQHDYKKTEPDQQGAETLAPKKDEHYVTATPSP
jgi:hypothetical protein